jgi:hypothetical protein
MFAPVGVNLGDKFLPFTAYPPVLSPPNSGGHAILLPRSGGMGTEVPSVRQQIAQCRNPRLHQDRAPFKGA